MKESITKFDLEAAFKALDDIEIPVTENGIKANKPALTEIFSKKSKFDILMEEYYDINSTADLTDAKEDREAEVAKAKLARIEKIVDLDAESADDLLTSYVGKFIIQCPQCMTLFYKNPEDVEASEDDETTVNVNEVCQHCGHESGYTLIGKVGEATEEETSEAFGEDPTEEAAGEEETTYTGDEEAEEASESEEDFDLDADLEELDLEIEDDEEEKKEESFAINTNSTQLVEQLKEEADLEISDSEFKELISSPEFKKPISDNSARAMMNEFSENSEMEEDFYKNKEERGVALSSLIVGDSFFKDGFQYEVISKNDDFSDIEVKPIGKTNPKDDINTGGLVLMRGSDIVNEISTEEELQEGGLGTLGKTIGKKLKQAGKNLKDKVSDAIDKFAESAKTRDEKADWVLENALEDYNKARITNTGELVPDENNKRFNAFVVIGFTNKYSNGKTITMAPSFNNKDLVMGMKKAQETRSYKDAENIAKGWSEVQGNGPAFIYLAKDKEDDEAVFLCEFFQGNLEKDQLEKYFELVKKHLEGAELMAQGGMDDSDESTEASSSATTSAEQSSTPSKADDTVEAEATATTEAFNAIINNLEELHESSLERHLSNYLIETFKNIAGFKITDCNYTDDKLNVKGNLFFTSGDVKKTTYVFSEAITAKTGKVNLFGTNKKFGLNRTFTITGSVDTNNKTFITEAFNGNKN